MLLHVSSLGEQPLVGAAEALAVSDADPLVLTLELLVDERLDDASLVLRRATAPAPGLAAGISNTSAGGSLAGVEWVVAAWGQARQVEGLSLVFTSKPNPLVVRVSIARGDSGWYLPPGPHTFTLGAAMQQQVMLPDTVAERVLVEFLDPQGVSIAVDLSETSPPRVQLGRTPRDLDLRVRGRRPMLRWSGAIPEGAGITIGDLRSRLEAELGATVRAEAVHLELRAAVAGDLALQWAFESLRVAERFVDGAPSRTMSIPWGGAVDETLLLDAPGGARVEALAVSITASSVAEQLVLAPDEDPAGNHGQLVRPLYDAAQALVLTEPWSLTGMDVLGRALTEGTSITVAIHPDAAGRPAAAAAFELQRVIAGPMAEPAWITFDLATPLLATEGRWWLVLRVDEGELVWATAPAPLGSLLHRRDRSQWLAHPAWNSLLRVRAVGEPPKQPLSLSLRGADAGAPESHWELPLSLAADGTVRWSAGAIPPPPSSTLALHLVADVATTVVLSNLELRYRPSIL